MPTRKLTLTAAAALTASLLLLPAPANALPLSTPTAITKTAPAPVTVTLSAAPVAGKTVTARVAGYKAPPTAALDDARIVWSVNGSVVQTRTRDRSDAHTFAVTSAHVGKSLQVRLQAYSGGAWRTVATGTAVKVTSSAAAPVTVSLSAAPVAKKTVTAKIAGYRAPAGAALDDSRVVWLVNGTAVQTRTRDRSDAHTFSVLDAHVGKSLQARLQAYSSGSWKTVTTSTAVKVAAPTVTAAKITISGTAAPRKTVSALVTGYRAPAGAALDDSRVVWLVNGAVSQTRTRDRTDAAKYAVQDSHVGKTLQARLQAYSGGAWRTVATSPAVTIAKPATSTNGVTLTIGGTLALNKTATVRVTGYKLPATAALDDSRIVWTVRGVTNVQIRTRDRSDAHKLLIQKNYVGKTLVARLQEYRSGAWRTVATSATVTIAK